ncbi:MAG TPA: hypothetical protein VE954_41930 [Oligoflexus sp.]|uniref:hypothetical protein n=1 Tax=Oligoflexus sp. TaxID=1971216 RepID=UPI002D68E4E1|nr:hypothetical protein [Oligoflexus sp.]HYX39702.1 hypothetical protein [Oligoflexus sp.]
MLLKSGVSALAITTAIAALWLSSCRNEAEISNTSVELGGIITKDTVWSAEKDYLLIGQVTVESGTRLTIEAGTTIKSIASDVNGLAPVLVIKPGAQIIADGTKEKPITFTSAADLSLLPKRGLWGGVIILGRAPVNQPPEKRFVEGIAGIQYGGSDPDDSSGILRYVRVWYGGRNIGENNEINGMTFAGVGRGTVVDHVEVAWNNDDAFEFFGGTVDAKYLSALFVKDDSFDTDLGYQGRLQHLFSLSGHDVAGRALEMDNDGKEMDLQPRSYPQVCNATFIGPGSDIPAAEKNEKGENKTDQTDQLIRLREGTGGDFRNILTLNGNGTCLRVSDSPTIALIVATAPKDSTSHSLYYSPNNVAFNCRDSAVHKDVKNLITVNEIDPQLTTVAIDVFNKGSLDPLPKAGSPVLSASDSCRTDEFFEFTNHVGAFKDKNWLKDWTWLDANGYLP